MSAPASKPPENNACVWTLNSKVYAHQSPKAIAENAAEPILQVVLQCLYSQCQTTQFGSALHHALSECSDPEADTPDTLPPLIRHQGLRKRGNQLTASVSASGKVAVHSIARRSVVTSASARYSARLTRSVAYNPAPSATLSPPTTPLASVSTVTPSKTSAQVPTNTS